MYLYLVRHGQSEGNVLRTFHGQTDYPLTEKGREQAREVSEKLRSDGVTFTRCCASNLIRAWDTAQACLEGRDITAEVCVGIREQSVGDIEGLSWEEVGERFPGLRERYISDWSHTTPPGGESPEVMMARVSASVDEIVARGEDTLMVAHFGSLSLAMVYLGVVTEEDALKPEWVVGQGTYTAIRIEDGKAELLFFNR